MFDVNTLFEPLLLFIHFFGMNGIITILEEEHDVFTIEKETTRLSDAIDNFKMSETNVYPSICSECIASG